jgi:putative DNA primase/helicase
MFRPERDDDRIKNGQLTLDQRAAELIGDCEESDAVHVNQPRPTEAMLYGLAGDVGNTAAATTEANRYAACMGFLSFLSAMAGRDVYLPVGNTRHHARLFTLHVGRSSRGRKGDALSLPHRVRHAIDMREHERGTVGGSLLGQVHTGGLSSREGLVMFIHDGFQQGKEETPAIDDKRLWVVESEFANVLQQAKRDGNTLSAALRDGWDGVSIKPATKTARTWATDPHIAIAGAITPSELCELIKARELSNGFANRFLIFWAERDRLVPFPTATDDETLTRLVERTEDVLRFMRGNYPAESDTRRMDMSQAAQDAYKRLYRGDLNKATGSVKLDGILERRAPMLLRLAMIFAMTDRTLTIEAQHIEAAWAWVSYAVDSVRYIFKEAAAGEVDPERLAAASNKLRDYLVGKGEATRKEITNECFNKRAPAGGLDAVIAELLNDTPPKIEAVIMPRRDGLIGKGRTIYRTLTPSTTADIADIGARSAFARDLSPADIGGQRASNGMAEKTKSAASPLRPQRADIGETCMDSQGPLSPPCPQPPNEKPANVVSF